MTSNSATTVLPLSKGDWKHEFSQDAIPKTTLLLATFAEWYDSKLTLKAK